jgi:hypothetical protein
VDPRLGVRRREPGPAREGAARNGGKHTY